MKKSRIVLIVLAIIISVLIFVMFPAIRNEDPVNRDELLGNSLIDDNIFYYGSINGYHFYKSFMACSMVVGPIWVDGYYFGNYSSGCAADLNNIGYFTMKDGISYQLQDLVDDGELKTRDIYFRIHIWNRNK